MNKKYFLFIILIFSFQLLFSQKIITIGIDENYPPYEFINEDGLAEGFNVDLTRAILKEYGFECAFIGKPWKEIYLMFKSGNIDVLSMLFSDKRNKKYLLSTPHNTVTYSTFYHAKKEKENKDFSFIQDLIVIEDDIMHEVIKEHEINKNTISFSNAEKALLFLEKAENMTAILPKLQGLFFKNKLNLPQITSSKHIIYPQKYCFAVKNNNQELIYKLNEGLAIIKENKKYDKLYAKWFFPIEKSQISILYSLRENYIFFIAIFIFILTVVFWNLLLKREVKIRNKELSDELMARERSEMAVIESEERFRTLSENSPAAIYIFNEKRIFFANESALSLSGYTFAEIKNLTFCDFTDTDFKPYVKSLFDKNILKSVHRKTIQISCKDGFKRWIDITFAKSYYKAEPVIIGTAFDASSQKTYEAELIESKRVYSTLLDNLSGLVYRCMNDTKWTMKFVSDGCFQLTGYTPSELVGNHAVPFSDIMHPEDREMVWGFIQEQTTLQLPFKIEYRIITKTNSVKWVLEQGKFVKSRDGHYIEGYIVDITDNIHTQQELLKKSKQLETTLQSIGDGVISTDINGVITMINDVAVELTGWSKYEAVGKKLEEVFNIINEDTEVKCENPVEKVLKTGQIVGLANHTALISKNGTRYIISDSAAPIKNEKGVVTGVILVFSDDTENKRKQDIIQANEAKLKATFEAIPDLIFRNNIDGFFTDYHAGNFMETIIPREKIIGGHISEIFNENFSKSLVEAYKLCVRTGETQTVEYYFDFADERSFFEARIVKYSDNEVLSLCRDISKRKIAEEKVAENLKQQILLSDLSTLFNTNDSFDTRINQVFEMLGSFFNVCRVYLLENYDNNKYCKNIHEWCIDPQMSEINNLQNVAYKTTPSILEKITKDGIVVSKSVENDFSGEELLFLKKQKIKSLIVLPVHIKTQFWGSIGFDNCSEERAWTISEIEFLKTTSNIIANAIEKEINYDTLQHEREQLEVTLHSIGDGVIVTDTSGTVIMINKTAEKLCGYLSDEAIGKPLNTIFYTVDEFSKKKNVTPVEKVIQTGQQTVLENSTLLISKENSEYYISNSASPIKDKNNNIIGIILVFRDNTERRKSLNAIQQSEEKYRKLFDFANDSIFIIKGEKIVNCNNKTCDIFGFSKEEIIGLTPYAISPEYQPDGIPSKEKATALIKKALDEDAVFFEWVHKRKDGSSFITEISLTPIEIEKEVHSLAIIRDISERKLIENALAESEEKYKTLVEKSNDGITIVADDKLLFTNKKLCEFTGFSAKELTEQPFLNFVDKVHHDTIIQYYNNRLEKKENIPNIYEISIIHKNGGIIPVEINSSFIYYNEKPAVLVTIRDITERKAAEDKLRLFKATIENSTDAIGMSTPEGIHVYQNKAFDILFGPLNNKIINKIFKKEKVKKEVFETIMSGGQWEGEIEMVSKEGEILNILLRAYANLDHMGNVTGLVGIHTDITQKKMAEYTLLKNEERFRMLLELAADAFFHGDENGNMIMVNSEAIKLTGFSKEELLKMNIKELFSEEVLSKKPLKYKTLSEGFILQTERDILRKDGKTVSVEMKSRKMPDGTYQSFFRDITDRKLAEYAVKKSEEEYRLLFENITQGFALHTIITDENGKPVDYRYETANPAFEKLTGIKIETIAGKRVKELLPNIETYWIEKFGNVAIDGKPINYENYSAEINKYFDTWVFSPKKGQFAVIFSDITERKLAEETIKSLLNLSQMGENTLQEITDYALEKCLELTKSEIAFLAFTDKNNSKLNFYSFSKDVVIHKNMPNPPNSILVEDGSLFYNAMTNKKPILINDYNNYSLKKDFPEWHMNIERVLVVPIEEDGKTVAIATAANKMMPYNETDIRRITLIIDRLWKIIQSKKHDESIRKLNEDLIDKNKEMEQFVYVTSHDLRSPLVNIQGFTKELVNASEKIKELIQSNTSIDKLRREVEMIYNEDINESLNYILLSAKKMDALLNGLLKLSRMGRIIPNIKPINVNVLVKDIINSVDFQLAKKNIKVSLGNLDNCSADELLLNQVFSNIIDNAIKYMDKQNGSIKIGSKRHLDKVCYTIEDNGPGIPEKHHQKIFEIFQRLDTKNSGEGLGLSIVQKIIEKHNGKIYLESKLDEGSKFFIEIPL